MKKSLLAAVPVVSLFFVGCAGGNPAEEKLLSIASESACFVQYSADAMKAATASGSTFNMQDFQAKRKEMGDKLNTLQKTSFDSKDAMVAAYALVTDKAGFRTKALDKAKQSCNAEAENVDRVLDEMNKDVQK